jgi:hypothetical protein
VELEAKDTVLWRKRKRGRGGEENRGELRKGKLVPPVHLVSCGFNLYT